MWKVSLGAQGLGERSSKETNFMGLLSAKKVDQVVGKKTEEDKDWKRKRGLTLKAFCFANLVLGMEHAMIAVTSWIYLKSLVKPKYQIIYYSFISVIYYVTGIVISLILCRYQDRRRDVRSALLWCNTITMLGNILYSAPPVSPALPLIGRALAGASQAFYPLMAAEVARCYDPQLAISMFSALALTGAFGFLLGIVINFGLVFVDITVRSYKITYANAPGIYMAMACFAMEFLIYFAVSDLSKVFDPKGKHEASAADSGQEPIKYTKDQDLEFPDKNLRQTEERTSGILEMKTGERQQVHDKGISQSNLEDKKVIQITELEFFRAERILNPQEAKLDYHHHVLSGGLSQAENRTPSRHGEAKSEDTMHSQYGEFSLAEMHTVDDPGTGQEASPLLESSTSKGEHRRELQKQMANSMINTLNVVAKLFKKFDSVAIVYCSFLFSFVIVSIKAWLPLLVVETLHWGPEELNLIMLGTALTSFVVLVFMWLVPLSHSNLYKISIFSTLIICVVLAVVILVKTFEKSFAVSVVGWIVFGSLFGFAVTLEDVFLVSTLAQMVPSTIQGFTESIRLTFTRFGAVLAMLLTAPTFSVVVPSSWAMILLILSTLCLMLARKDQLTRPALLVRPEEAQFDAEKISLLKQN